MDAQIMECVLMVYVLVKMDGVVLIAVICALEMVNIAMEMENVWKESATAVLDGPAMRVISTHASTTALDTVTVSTERVFVNKATVGEIAASPPTNPVSVLFTVFVAASLSVRVCTKHKALDLRMSATQNALRLVSHSVLLESLPSRWTMVRRYPQNRWMSLDRKQE
jgi:hypothetical protein